MSRRKRQTLISFDPDSLTAAQFEQLRVATPSKTRKPRSESAPTEVGSSTKTHDKHSTGSGNSSKDSVSVGGSSKNRDRKGSSDGSNQKKRRSIAARHAAQKNRMSIVSLPPAESAEDALAQFEKARLEGIFLLIKHILIPCYSPGKTLQEKVCQEDSYQRDG